MNLLKVNEPITLITGSREGIGRGLAEHYLRVGHKVIGCSRGPTDLSHPNYTHFQANVSDEKNVAKIFSFIGTNIGRLDNLINNAGIASMNHCLLTPIETLNKIFSTNVVGSFLFCREAARIMQKSKYGRIVNFTSVAVPLNLEGESVYAASKAGIESLTKILAKELGSFGITVNAIGPTPVETNLIRNVPEEKIKKLITRQAIKRMGTQDDIENVVDFFLRKESDFVSGQILYLGGI